MLFFVSEVRELGRFEVLNSGVTEDSSLRGCYTLFCWYWHFEGA
jgi:hypothetical protein